MHAWWFTSLCRPDNTFLRKVVALTGEGPAECYDGIDGVEVWDDTLVIPLLVCDQLGDTNKILHLSGRYCLSL